MNNTASNLKTQKIVTGGDYEGLEINNSKGSNILVQNSTDRGKHGFHKRSATINVNKKLDFVMTERGDLTLPSSVEDTSFFPKLK